MKKEYMKPLVEIVEINLQSFICISGTGASVTDYSNGQNDWTNPGEDGWPDDTEEDDGD